MPETTVTDTGVLLTIIIIAVSLLCIFSFIFKVIVPFCDDRNYIKMEMQRSYDEGEYRYWKRELKRLYISHIPIIGRLLLKYFR